MKYFISMDLEENTNGIYSQKLLVEKGKKLLAEGNKKFLEAKINPDKMGIMLHWRDDRVSEAERH